MSGRRWSWTTSLWITSWMILAFPLLVLSNNQDIHVENTVESTEAPGNQTDHPDHEPHGIHIVSWRWEELWQPVLAVFLILAVSLLKVVFHHADRLSSVIPESCMLILFGCLIGVIHEYTNFISEDLRLKAPLFFNFLLPPIVLDSAYSLNDRVFFDNLGTILLYAVVGTLMNFFIIGPALYGLSIVGAMGSVNLGFVQALVFASFIVAVDPVAVLAIFQEVGVNNVLYFLVFGESLLNDAVTVVLYNMMKTFDGMDSIPMAEIWLGVAVFACDSLGSLGIGILVGMITALLTRVTYHVKLVEPIIIIAMAYLSYMAAELIHWSGIISMIGCGLVQAQYAHQNISRKSLLTVKFLSKILMSTSEAIIFLFLGLEVVSTSHVWSTGFVLWSLALCLVVRFMSVTSLTWFANRAITLRLHKIGMKEQFIMWYGGLRGAVCFALCSSLDEDFPFKQMYLTATLFVVFFTVFIQGITIKPLVTTCHIKRKEEQVKSVAMEFNSHVTDHVMAGIEVIVGQFHGDNHLRTEMQRFNDCYMKKIFQRNPMTHSEKILQFYQKSVIKDHERLIYGTARKKTVKFEDGTRELEAEEHLVPITEDFDINLETDEEKQRKLSRPGWETDVDMDRFKQALRKNSVARMHQTYDPNLTRDDDRDILVQLESKHNLQRRVSEMGLRKYSSTRRTFSYDAAMDAQRRRRESSTTSGEDNVFYTNETAGSRRGCVRQLSQGNRQAERVKKLSPKMRRHSSHQSSFRSSGSSAGLTGYDNLAYIEEDDESATSEDILDKDDTIKNTIIKNITEEEMTDSMRRKRKIGTGKNPQNSVPTERLSIGPDTFTELELKQANGVVPSDNSGVEEESELRRLGDQTEPRTTNDEELNTKDVTKL